jgi:hypothetical protein
MRKLAISTLVLAIQGCASLPGDGFRVRGALPETAEACELVLYAPGPAGVPLESVPIRAAFEKDLVVSPSMADYRVSVLCAGVMARTAVIRYGTVVMPGDVVEFGSIDL